jgi:formylglycine-generating enzyme required for sulfatase activity
MNAQYMLPVGTLLHGGVYRVEGYLSSGGFGNTYVVRNVEFDEVYALKEFYIKGVCQRDGDSTSISVSNSENAECFTQQREKFKKEARRIRGLHNDHIVKVYDLFEENGTAYYVMDLVDGESLKDHLKRTGLPLTEAEVNILLPQILDGLKAIHDMHIWHLDIKPANIMVDKHGTVNLIDFGASKQQSGTDGTTLSSAICYTMGYAPSEQMAQEYNEFGPWTDFYALGATLYKLLTLQNPPSITKVAKDHTKDKHVALPMPQVSDNMRLLIAWMMQNESEKRPQSTAEILGRLAKEDDVTVMVEPTVDDSENTVITETKKPKSTPKSVNEKPKAPQKPVCKKPQTTISNETMLPTSFEEENSNSKLRKVLYAVIAAIVIGAGVVWGVMSKNGARQDGAVTESQQEISYTTFTVNGVSFDMAKVEAGTFTMGATSDYDNAHQVTLTNNYYLGKTEVTQALWKAVMGSNPSYFKGDNKPVEQVSWEDCQEFISKLNAATGKHFRLPTEAEWEFAARGGNNSRHYQYSGSNTLNDVGWYTDNSSNTIHDVATKRPNELGLYDMSGNVWEWCSDWYGSYSSNTQYDPAGPLSGSDRVLRGGYWGGDGYYCRSWYRGIHYSVGYYSTFGFRLALSE